MPHYIQRPYEEVEDGAAEIIAEEMLSTLRKTVKAMGGELDIRAIFPDGVVRIKQFKELRKHT